MGAAGLPSDAGLAQAVESLDEAAARGDRTMLLRLMINDVVGPNTGMRIPRYVFPLLYRSRFGRIGLANASAIPTGLRAFEGHA